MFAKLIVQPILAVAYVVGYVQGSLSAIPQAFREVFKVK